MDKHEIRRRALARLVAKLGRGGQTQVAAAIEKDPSYVSRMLYPPGKRGGKRIGEDSVDILDREYPGWLDETALAELARLRREEATSLLQASSREQDLALVKMIAERSSPADAAAFAKIFLHRVESDLAK